MSQFVVPISSVDKRDIDSVGKYAGELGELCRIGIPIPDGFVITTSCFKQFLNENNLNPTSKGKEIIHASLPKDIIREIANAYKHLGGTFRESTITATSSSPFSSFNSIHYEVKGDANLILKIKEIWASQFGIAVVVQKKIESVKTGTLFTQDPYASNKTIIHIKHKNMTSHYSISKNNLDIIFKGHLSKTKKSHRISDQEAVELANIGKKLEKYFYFPQEVKFAIDKNTIYITETKPITNIATKPFSYNLTLPMPRKPKIGKDILLKGISYFPGIATGPVKVLSNFKDLESVVPGQIIVASSIETDSFSKIKKAGALITENTSFAGADKILYARVVARPLILNAKNATKVLHAGNVVTVDGVRGEIYKGGL